MKEIKLEVNFKKMSNSKILSFDTELRNLNKIFESEDFSIAVSGGIDSLILSILASKIKQKQINIFHAVSPAVQKDGTKRTRLYAKKYNWNLKVINADEFSDSNYLKNPRNRCFYCKFNLYKKIKQYTSEKIYSGTNYSDLSDFRPGLDAAKEYNIRHPFVEAKITKTMIREFAKNYGLNSLASLPAQPCLSSRIYTGIEIDKLILDKIYLAEKKIQTLINSKITRCRFGKTFIKIELDNLSFLNLTRINKRKIEDIIKKLFEKKIIIYFSEYKMGSTFLVD